MAGNSTERLYSLDAFRGLTMIWMFSEGFGLGVFERDPGWKGALAQQFDHADWIGFNAWDLIQPFFMFIVGVAMPLAFARREAAGQGWGEQFRHVLKRCALLIGFGLLARSIQAGRPVIDLINVLAQVAVTYFITFLLLKRGWKVQTSVAFALLAVTWSVYRFAPFPDPWAKNDNIGWWLDGWLLGRHWSGGYATLNCIPSSFNTILGAAAGVLLRSSMSVERKGRTLLLAGLALVAAGWAMHAWIPVSKKIWTPSFAIASTGYCLLALLAFWLVCDVWGRKAWARSLVMVGANSIFIYLFHEILNVWMHASIGVFTGWAVDWWGGWGRVFQACLLVAFQIWVCVWLYRRKILFRI